MGIGALWPYADVIPLNKRKTEQANVDKRTKNSQQISGVTGFVTLLMRD
jgi:hypothetical protein